MASVLDDEFESDLPTKDEKEKPKRRSKNREALTPTEVRQGHQRLLDMVEGAFATLEAATKEADYPTAIKAATVILDRAGFGPKSTVDVNTTTRDLSQLSREELAARAQALSKRLQDQLGTIPVATVVPVSETIN